MDTLVVVAPHVRSGTEGIKYVNMEIDMTLNRTELWVIANVKKDDPLYTNVAIGKAYGISESSVRDLRTGRRRPEYKKMAKPMAVDAELIWLEIEIYNNAGMVTYEDRTKRASAA